MFSPVLLIFHDPTRYLPDVFRFSGIQFPGSYVICRQGDETEGQKSYESANAHFELPSSLVPELRLAFRVGVVYMIRSPFPSPDQMLSGR